MAHINIIFYVLFFLFLLRSHNQPQSIGDYAISLSVCMNIILRARFI